MFLAHNTNAEEIGSACVLPHGSAKLMLSNLYSGAVEGLWVYWHWWGLPRQWSCIRAPRKAAIKSSPGCEGMGSEFVTATLCGDGCRRNSQVCKRPRPGAFNCLRGFAVPSTTDTPQAPFISCTVMWHTVLLGCLLFYVVPFLTSVLVPKPACLDQSQGGEFGGK